MTVIERRGEKKVWERMTLTRVAAVSEVMHGKTGGTKDDGGHVFTKP
jgi:hypothetical protein